MLCTLCISTQNHQQHQTKTKMCINVHTADKVTMSVDEWLPHYLIQVGLILIQRVKSKRVLIQSFKPT